MSQDPPQTTPQAAGSAELSMAQLRAAEERLLPRIHAKRPTRDVNRLHQERMALGQRVADAVAAAIGSWTFIIIQSALLLAWMALNVTQLIWNAWDPYPFILLNLVLSFQAAYAAPVIMMSQNRQSEKDRLKADLDLETDLKAETMIEELHGGMEDLRLAKWSELLQIQDRQIAMLDSMLRRLGAEPAGA